MGGRRVRNLEENVTTEAEVSNVATSQGISATSKSWRK